MPANLPPQYFEAEKQYRMAKGPEDKIEALQLMLAIMPRHKGTDKLHAGLRRKIAKLSSEAEKRSATARRAGFYVAREGAGQVILLGPTNTGKSQLLTMLTEATPEIAAYPFTSTRPLLGMMRFENIQIQLVDTPPIEYREAQTLLNNAFRGADIIAIVVSLEIDVGGQVERVLQSLRQVRIEHLLPDDRDLPLGAYAKKMLIVGNKKDLPGSDGIWQHAVKRYSTSFPMIAVSAQDGTGLEEFKRKIFQEIDIIRVYTKVPGEKADLTDPVILRSGSNVMDAAESIHKDFQAKLKYAVAWGAGKFNGQRVSRNQVLQDGDIVEFHI